MNTMIKTTLATAAMGLLFTGCSVEDAVTQATSGVGSGSGRDDITLSKTADGFMINWNKNYSGYSEVIYTDGSSGDRGNGYPFTNNATGTYTMTCVERSSANSSVSYRCTRPDITATSSVTLEKGTEYQWLVSYGTDHEHGEVDATMEYSGGILIIE